MVNFEKVNLKQSFPELEEAILEFWKANNIFKKSIENRCDCEEYNFYDGPPFATGTPHYWHILAWTIKDVVPRYQTMIWKKVERRFGWDTHWLPIENIVEKKLNISWKDDIEKKIWVFKFNETCRENVFGYVDEWRQTVERMWRWVDMDNDYKTMDTDFMESVWWVFKTIYDKWLIYEWNRIVPYCPRCTTPLSNFEVNQGYEDKQDKSVTVKFKVKDSEKKYILAWTTTPWTLVANLGLAVWEDIEYAELMDKTNSEIYILAKDRIWDYYKDQEDYEILRIYKWKCLEWISYEPLFPDFVAQKDLSEFWKDFYLWKNAYKVVTWHHVTTESWTWIVHIAPAYWEDDNIIWKEKDLGFVAHISDTGKTENLLEDNDIYVFEFNDLVIEKLKKSGELVKISTINHSYPHCWRCHTPLIYRAISAWYVDVTAIKEHMIKNNQKITWVPGDIRNWRMWKWLEWAKDWNISRNRYWWSAIPVWQNEDKTEEVCIGSIKELYELNKDFGQIEEKDGKYFYKDTGKEIDLHKHFVDEILVKNPKTWNTLRRIPEVLDCWFESGSMPYASKHYMGQELEKSGEYLVSKDWTFKFPADFIAEWLDQTRGWFYTLIILWTALFDETPFKNCIVNWIVLAEDGKKMSKSLQNYPAPELIFDKYGADAMRFYLLNSPVVEAQDFRFSETWVEEVVKKVILPLWNTYYFFTTYANIDNFEPKGNLNSENILDKWLISELNELTLEVRTAFDNYELNQATRPILKFMDNLTNWYIRRSRKRFWKSENDSDKLNAYETLYFALVELTKILAPFVPFVSEYIYKNLTKKESVHLEDFPSYNKNLIDLKLNENTDKIQKIINLWLAWRANQKIRVRQPLQSITITEVFDDYYNEIIKEELNVKSVLVVDWSSLAKKICKPNWRNIWPKFGANVKFIMSEAKSWNFEELTNWNVKVWEFELEAWDFELVYEASNSSAKIESWFGMVISMDEKITDELKQEWFARDLVRHIQESRKEADYNVEDRIFVKIESLELAETIKNFTNYIESETLSKITNDLENSDLEKNISVEWIEVKICLKK